MVPVLSDRPAEQARPFHARKVETVLCQLRVSPKPLLLHELESSVYSGLLGLLERLDRVLVSFGAEIAQHVFWHAPSSMVGHVHIIT